jgi:hypothetical protein
MPGWRSCVPGRDECGAGDDEAEARKRAVVARAPEQTGSWKTRIPPMSAARLAATEVRAMTSTPGPIWRLGAEAEKAIAAAIRA